MKAPGRTDSDGGLTREEDAHATATQPPHRRTQYYKKQKWPGGQSQNCLSSNLPGIAAAGARARCLKRARPFPRDRVGHTVSRERSLIARKVTLRGHELQRRRRSYQSALQRLDLHLAELHNASAPLKGDWPPGKLAVLDIDGLDAIEHDGKARTFRRDLIGVPFAAGLGHG